MTRQYTKNNLTKKQRLIMTVVVAGNKNDEGQTISWLDIDQLLERIPYSCTKQALQYSLRYLFEKGMVEFDYVIRRTKRRRVIIPTDKGYAKVSVTPPAQIYADLDSENVIYE